MHWRRYICERIFGGHGTRDPEYECNESRAFKSTMRKLFGMQWLCLLLHVYSRAALHLSICVFTRLFYGANVYKMMVE